MKYKKISTIIATLLIVIPVLSGCGRHNHTQNNTDQTTLESENSNSSLSESLNTSETSSIDTETISDVSSETTLPPVETETELSSDTSTTTIVEPVHDPKKVVDLYAINDVHGRILENHPSRSRYEPGLAKTATYIKQLKSQSTNFIFLNSGDMFQDTYDSFSNYGNLMAQAMPLMETEAMTIGNHEFDWGIDKLKQNRLLAGNTAFLGANIYHYDNVLKKATDFASEIAQPYKIVERNGLKIGIIGIIGKDQITSIMSKIVNDYIFLEPTQIVMNLSDELKGEKDCDAVVVAAHADFDQLQEQSNYNFAKNVTDQSPITNKRYVDAVFTAHSHKNQRDLFNGVPFIQSGCHGEKLGHIQLDLNYDPMKLTGFESVNIPEGLDPDIEVEALVNKYLDDNYYKNKDEVIGTTDISNLSRHNAGNMLAWMTYETLMDDPNLPVDQIDVVLNNGGRSSVTFDGSELTRGKIFNALPFTNQTYIAKVKGDDIIKEVVDYNYPYYAPNEITIDPQSTYTIAIIDYLLFHKNAEREYNYFKSFTGETLYCEPRYTFELISDYIAAKKHVSYDEITNKPEYRNILN